MHGRLVRRQCNVFKAGLIGKGEAVGLLDRRGSIRVLDWSRVTCRPGLHGHDDDRQEDAGEEGEGPALVQDRALNIGQSPCAPFGLVDQGLHGLPVGFPDGKLVLVQRLAPGSFFR